MSTPPLPSIDQDDRDALTAAGWPTEAPVEALAAADAEIAAGVIACDAILPGLGDFLRHIWQQIRPQPTCDCPRDPHRWDCPLTPLWAQLADELESTELPISPWPNEYFETNSSPYTLSSLMVIHCWRCRRMHTLGSCFR